MKILHINLCGPVTDDFTYQDNLLPKYHKKLGFEVAMITSRYSWNSKGQISATNRRLYFNQDKIKVMRIENKFGTTIRSKFKLYKDLYKKISRENPDILFVHGVQFLDIITVRRYLKKHPHVRLYIDNHADLVNSASTFLSKNLLHKVIWKKAAHIMIPYTHKFYGVLPLRVSFLREIYGLPDHMTELLVLGADDELIKRNVTPNLREETRNKHTIQKEDFLIVTGGKIGPGKRQTIDLMDAVRNINRPNVKLVIFGSIDEKLKKSFMKRLSENIIYLNWLDAEESYKIFNAADLVCFPGSHSVFWEQVVAIGKPMLVKYWKGITHIDLGGNCSFLQKSTTEEIEEKLLQILSNEEVYNEMKNVAYSNEKKQFLYSNIAKKSIGIK